MLDTIFKLLVAPPGNLIYHLSLAFSVFASLQATWINRRNAQPAFIGRTLLGLNLILVAQLLHFLSSGLAWQGVLNGHLFLPVLDRAIIFFSLVWIAWLWLFPTPLRAGDIGVGVLSAVAVGLFLFTFANWNSTGMGVNFNASWIDWTWTVPSAVLAAVALVLLLVIRPPEWGVGFGMIGLFLVGLSIHLLIAPAEGDFSGFIRLAMLAAYPLLPALLVRTSRAADQRGSFLPATSSARAEHGERRSRSSDPRTVRAWLDLSVQTEPDKICLGVSRAVAQTMLADLCFILSTSGGESSPVIFQGGYDLIREDEISGSLLEANHIPAIAGALARGRAVRWNEGEAKPVDLEGLCRALQLKEAGNVLLIPLAYNNAPWGGLLLLTAYSHRSWTVEDQNYLASEAELIAKTLHRAQEQSERKLELERIKSKIETLQKEAETLQHENEDLLEQLASKVQEPVEYGISEIEGLLALQKENQDTILNLQSENERMRSGVKIDLPVDSAREMDHMEEELRSSLQEMARLQNLWADSNLRIMELERKVGESVVMPGEDREVIASIVQDLRQPMSSIMGYTDLLLAESVGILGALQRKFLERIRASTDRLRGYMDDLIHVSSTVSGDLELVHQPVDLGEVIDKALADVRTQLREKDITIQVDLPEELPPVYADRDALHQIVSHLLQNAGYVSPVDGTITLKANFQAQNEQEFLTLQVTDQGGGIPTEDLPRVFARRYRADNALVQGIGDTGVGLSIAKTLVEAHGGRIWVESITGESSTFTILLPIRPEELVRK